MIPADIDIHRVAWMMIKRYGVDAAVQAAMRGDALLAKGDLDGMFGVAGRDPVDRAVADDQAGRGGERAVILSVVQRLWGLPWWLRLVFGALLLCLGAAWANFTLFVYFPCTSKAELAIVNESQSDQVPEGTDPGSCRKRP